MIIAFQLIYVIPLCRIEYVYYVGVLSGLLGQKFDISCIAPIHLPTITNLLVAQTVYCVRYKSNVRVQSDISCIFVTSCIRIYLRILIKQTVFSFDG